MQPIQGLHHITAVARDPQANVDFYRQVLGQRLVKTTVNFDDPSTYHFYYGDNIGSPGTLLTFFPWRGVKPGRPGNGETAAVAYTIAPDTVDFWEAHLKNQGLRVERATDRFGSLVLAFQDPDGMRLELIAEDVPATLPVWEDGPIPAEYALRGFHSVTLWLDDVEPTAALLVDHMGYRYVGQEGSRYRYKGASDTIGMYIDILHRPDAPRGQFGAGSIHHIAFRTADDPEQTEYLARLRGVGFRVTPVQPRQYFNSIYFRTPGGVLFEIATDPPGCLIDEDVSKLGENLRLPPWYEPHRAEIERALPPFERKPVKKVEVDNV